MLRSTLLFLVLALSILLHGQTPLSGDLVARINNIIDNLPGAGGEQLDIPTSTERANWQLMVEHILDEQYVLAATEADALGYELFAYTDNTGDDKLYYLLEEKSPRTKYWGTFVFNPIPCRSGLVIQSPHALFDFNTAKEGIYVFHQLNARAFMMSGTHRCNLSAYSSCTGTTSVCSDHSEPYRKSDMAHTEESMFHATTTEIMEGITNSVFIQLHGFAKKATDPYVIMSNGTDQTPAVDYLLPFRDELIAIDPVLTFKIPHIDIGWTRLTGFWNTQGRMLNGESNPCTSAATSSSGRFIHMEQEKTRLRNNATGWNKVSTALGNTFLCMPLPIEILDFYGVASANGQVKLTWNVGIEKNLAAYILERSQTGNAFHQLAQLSPYAGARQYTYTDLSPLPGNNFYRLKMIDIDGQTTYSSTITVIATPQNHEWHLYPNPFSNSLHIEIGQWQGRNIQIFNNLANPISTYIPLKEQQTTLDLSVFKTSAPYWIGLFDSNHILLEVKRVVKM